MCHGHGVHFESVDLQVAAHLAALQRQLEVPRDVSYDESGRLENMIGPTPGCSVKVTSLTSNPVILCVI